MFQLRPFSKTTEAILVRSLVGITCHVVILLKRTGRYRERLQTLLLKSRQLLRAAGMFLDKVTFGHYVQPRSVCPPATTNMKKNLPATDGEVVEHTLASKAIRTKVCPALWRQFVFVKIKMKYRRTFFSSTSTFLKSNQSSMPSGKIVSASIL